MKKSIQKLVIYIFVTLASVSTCKLASAEELNKTESDIFIRSLKSIIEYARELNYAKFIPLASKHGIIATRYYSAGIKNVSFVNRFSEEKIPKTLNFATGTTGAQKLTIPGMLDALKDTGVKLDPSKCKPFTANVQTIDFDAVLKKESINSKAAEIAKHFYRVFSLANTAKQDIAQICIANKEQTQAYFGLVTTPEDGSNEMIFGAALFFQRENNLWRLRGLAEFL